MTRFCKGSPANSLTQSSSQLHDYKSSWRDFSEVRGRSGGSFPEGGLDFLKVALVWTFPYRTLLKQASKKFASEPPELLRSPSRNGSMRKLVLALSYSERERKRKFIKHFRTLEDIQRILGQFPLKFLLELGMSRVSSRSLWWRFSWSELSQS